jgi:hypothetical protein
MYPLLHPSIRHRYVPTSSSIHFFIHPSITIKYPTSSRALLHPSIHQHKVPNLLPCTFSSIHPSSICTHFFIHPSVIIMYPLRHPSIFHPSVIIIPGRASIIPGPVGRNTERENQAGAWSGGTPSVKIKPGPSQSQVAKIGACGVSVLCCAACVQNESNLFSFFCFLWFPLHTSQQIAALRTHALLPRSIAPSVQATA